MAILSKVTGFWDGFSFVKNVKKMREALIEYFKEEGIACEIKDGSLLFEYDECHYTVNFAAGDDYAECGITYSIEDEAYTALELSDKTFIAAKQIMRLTITQLCTSITKVLNWYPPSILHLRR